MNKQLLIDTYEVNKGAFDCYKARLECKDCLFNFPEPCETTSNVPDAKYETFIAALEAFDGNDISLEQFLNIKNSL